VTGLAPTNAVAQDMGRDGFTRAATIHSELFAIKNGRTTWHSRTVIMVDEAAMIDTKLMAQVATYANAAEAKLVLVGDDRQLSSIDRGGMFAVLKSQYGAAELSEVRRQSKNDDRRAAELMAEGNFHDALARYDAKGGIKWTRTQEEAHAALVRKWAKDTEADPSKTRFVFAYTNEDVNKINFAIRRVRRERGELGEDHTFATARGRETYADGDRIQIIGTDKKRGLFNGNAGTIKKISSSTIHVQLDGRAGQKVEFDAKEFKDFRHGYAGTIYKGQGRTLDQTYLYHSEYWRSAASYVALTRHRDTAELFVARNTAADVKELARQMARVDERRAASHFYQTGEGSSRQTTSESAARAGFGQAAREAAGGKKADGASQTADSGQQQSTGNAFEGKEQSRAAKSAAGAAEGFAKAPSREMQGRPDADGQGRRGVDGVLPRPRADPDQNDRLRPLPVEGGRPAPPGDTRSASERLRDTLRQASEEVTKLEDEGPNKASDYLKDRGRFRNPGRDP
jgi:AAA domain